MNKHAKNKIMIDNLIIPNIRLFIFGTLRKGCKFDYYMEGSNPLGLYYSKGTLMESTIGSAYIDFNNGKGKTIGELYHVNYFCLQRINHLENTSGEFPKGYDLDILPVWIHNSEREITFNEDEKTIALYYRRRHSPIPVPGGDWMDRKDVLGEIEKLLRTETEKTLYHNDVINYIMKYLHE